MCKLQHDTATVTSSTASRSSLEKSFSFLFFFFFFLVARGLLRFITIIAGEHLLNVKRFLGIFECFAEAKTAPFTQLWEPSLMEYSPVSTDSGFFTIPTPWFDHALKQQHNHERYANIFALQTNLPLSKMIHFCFLGFLIHFRRWARTRSLAEGSWHCCHGFAEAEHSISCLSAVWKRREKWNLACEINPKETWRKNLKFKFLGVFTESHHVSPLATLQCSFPTSPFYFQASNSFSFFFLFFPFISFPDQWNSACFSGLIYGPWVKARLWFKSRVLLTF